MTDDTVNFVPAGSFIDLTGYSGTISNITLVAPGNIQVQFVKSGSRYEYANVPPALWEFLLKGKQTKDGNDKFSIGAAFYQEVVTKPDLYPYRKVE